MKKLITALAIGAFTFAGTAIHAEARPWFERGQPGPQYGNNHNQVCRTYTQRYIAGYDRHGHPVYRYRTVSTPSGNRHGGYDHGYRGGYQNGHYDNRRGSGYGNSRASHRGGYYGNRSGSGASVRFSYGR